MRRVATSTSRFVAGKSLFPSHIFHTSMPRSSYYFSCRQRYISTDSWAAEAVTKTGEKVEPAAPQPPQLVDEKLIKNPSPEVRKLCDQILALSVVEVHQLLMLLQTRLGISDEMLNVGGGAVATSATTPAEAPAAAPAKKKEAFDVKLGAVDAKAKIKIIKEVRAITGLGLKEAKELVEKAPVVIKTAVKKEEAEHIKKLIVDAGGVVEVL